MILLKLKSYIKQHQRVSLNDIKAHFDLSEEAAQGLMQPLLQQGHVLAVNITPPCQSKTCNTHCCSQLTSSTIYQWSASPKKQIPIPIKLLDLT